MTFHHPGVRTVKHVWQYREVRKYMCRILSQPRSRTSPHHFQIDNHFLNRSAGTRIAGGVAGIAEDVTAPLCRVDGRTRGMYNPLRMLDEATLLNNYLPVHSEMSQPAEVGAMKTVFARA